MLEHLFVYGTLAPGKPNEHILSPLKGEWSDAFVNGYLKKQGWGAKLGYPGLILNKNGNKVSGKLFSSEQLHTLWNTLDRFEGMEYKRILTTIDRFRIGLNL